MADLRDDLRRWEREGETGLKEKLAEESMLGIKKFSVSPLAAGMFDRIAPSHRLVDMGKKNRDVEANAIALKVLLHEQIGRPLHRIVGRPTVNDYAQCVTAVYAYDNGVEQQAGAHVPTSLPREIDELVDEPPARTHIPSPPFDPITDLNTGWIQRLDEWKSEHREVAESPYFVYELDCTPGLGDDEDDNVRLHRRVVKTKIKHGDTYSNLEGVEQAAYKLSRNNRIFYVGVIESLGKDVQERVEEHIRGIKASGVKFTTYYPPQQLVDVHGCQTVDEARKLEGKRRDYIDGLENMFAFSDAKEQQ